MSGIAMIVAIVAILGVFGVGSYMYFNQPEDVDVSDMFENSIAINENARDIGQLEDDIKLFELDDEILSNLIEEVDDNHDDIRDVIRCLRKYDSVNDSEFEECIEDKF